MAELKLGQNIHKKMVPVEEDVKNGNVKVHAAQLSVSTRWHKSDFHWRPVMHQGGKVTGKKGKLSL